MVKVSSFKDRTVAIKVTVSGSEINLTVRPNVMTPAMERRMAESDGAAGFDLLLGIFCLFVASWDVTGDDDEPLPLTPESVADIPSMVLMGLLSGAQDQLRVSGN